MLKARLLAKPTVVWSSDRCERDAAKAHSGTAPEARPSSTARSGASAAASPCRSATRAFFEPRFGWDFGVRVHTDGAAAATARGLRARAFTVGRDIVFGAGEYAPATTPGRALMAHELAHVVQQAPGRAAPQVSVTEAEREADAAAASRGRVPISARPIAVHRQPAPGKTGMTRDELRQKLKVIFGHDVTIEVGDKERQTRELGGPPARRKLPDDWKAWDPGASSPLYDEILGAIEDFGREIGGVPDIGQSSSTMSATTTTSQLNVVADTNAAAQIRSRGIMIVYRAALFETAWRDRRAAFSRSASICPPGAAPRGRRGRARRWTRPTRAESQRRTVAHELGHGVELATGSLDEFEQTVGWVRVGAEPRLYDIQAKGVTRRSRRAPSPRPPRGSPRATGTPARTSSNR